MASTKWYYYQDGKSLGPFDYEVLLQMKQGGALSDDTLVTQAGSNEWLKLKDALANLPPTLPVGDQKNNSDIQFLSPARNPAKSEESKTSEESLIVELADRVSKVSGLEKLQGFSLQHLFSQTLKRHSPEEIEEHFIAGTKNTTPLLSEVNPNWPTPWAFFRLLLMSIVATVLFYYAIERFENILLIPGWIFVGCFGIPFATLVFFLEINVLRNISFYRVLFLMFMGGLLSMIFSLFLFDFTRLHDVLGAMSAGFVEELGKLAAVIYFTRKWNHCNWVLNGLLLGAAVGTGFSAFESAGYVFVQMARWHGSMESVMILRAALSPLTHTIWTAAITAALWRVKKEQPFHFKMLLDQRFLRIFAIIAGLHMLWNSPLSVPFVGKTLGDYAFRVILGLIGWIVILLLVQSGLREIQSAQKQFAAS